MQPVWLAKLTGLVDPHWCRAPAAACSAHFGEVACASARWRRRRGALASPERPGGMAAETYVRGSGHWAASSVASTDRCECCYAGSAGSANRPSQRSCTRLCTVPAAVAQAGDPCCSPAAARSRRLIPAWPVPFDLSIDRQSLNSPDGAAHAATEAPGLSGSRKRGAAAGHRRRSDLINTS